MVRPTHSKFSEIDSYQKRFNYCIQRMVNYFYWGFTCWSCHYYHQVASNIDIRTYCFIVDSKSISSYWRFQLTFWSIGAYYSLNVSIVTHSTVYSLTSLQISIRVMHWSLVIGSCNESGHYKTSNMWKQSILKVNFNTRSKDMTSALTLRSVFV